MAEADAEHRDALCMQLAKMLLKWRYPRWGCVGAEGGQEDKVHPDPAVVLQGAAAPDGTQ
jgi:hypothetical protein